MTFLKDFKYAFRFLGIFLLIYFLSNVLYGLYVESFGDRADPMTSLVTHQTGLILNGFSQEVKVERNTIAPTVYIKADGRNVVSVYEGCNGINVMIVFLAFLFAFGGRRKVLWWFLPVGLLTIHFFNLGRIAMLVLVARYQPEAFYFLHKYMFTAVLYLVVFMLWFLWVVKYNEKGLANPAY